MSVSSSASPNSEGRSPLLAIALDVSGRNEALRLAAAVQPWCSVAKVGLELFCAAGPSIVGELSEAGLTLFVDLKLHDIPTTVERAATVLGRLGVAYATVHAAGGVAMVRAAAEGLAAGAAEAGLPVPVALGVTVLTSEAEASAALLEERVGIILAAGAGGLVCAADDLGTIRAIAPRLVAVVPGIRPEGTAVEDQARVATPIAAARAGADVLVLGRAVTHAVDPAAAAAAIAASLIAV